MAAGLIRFGRQSQLRSLVACGHYFRNTELNFSVSQKLPLKETPSLTETNASITTFVPVYRLPYIVALKTVCRIKIYQTVLTVAGAGICTGLAQAGLASPTLAIGVIWLGSLAVGVLYIMGEFFRRIIGFAYLSEDKKFVKLSHLGFWGNRVDLIIPIEDLIPLPETEERASDLYVKIRRYSSDKTLYLSLRYGKLVDVEMFKEIFGDPSLYK